MTAAKLKALFEDAVAGEPSHDVPVHEDVARGRTRRGRIVRRRATGGVLVAAAVTAGLVLPASSPVSLLDGQVGQGSTTGGVRGDAVLSPEVADDPLKLAMWEAVDDALPSDVELVENSYVYGDGPGPDLYLSLERGDVSFTLSVWMQNSRPDLPPYRPCTEPEPLIGQASLWTNCREGTDDEGRWRVMGDQGPDTFAILEGGPAAVAMRWGILHKEVDDEGRLIEPVSTALTESEADALVDAVWSVGSQHAAADLVSGIDLVATAEEAWPDIESALESELGLGPLTPADAPEVAIDDPDHQVGMISASYVTEGGIEVDLAVWQRDRLYQPMCVERYGECAMFPGAVFATGDGDAPTGHGVTGTVGQRAQLLVRVGSADPDLEQAVARANVEAIQLLPFLGDARYPMPDEM